MYLTFPMLSALEWLLVKCNKILLCYSVLILLLWSMLNSLSTEVATVAICATVIAWSLFVLEMSLSLNRTQCGGKKRTALQCIFSLHFTGRVELALSSPEMRVASRLFLSPGRQNAFHFCFAWHFSILSSCLSHQCQQTEGWGGASIMSSCHKHRRPSD